MVLPYMAGQGIFRVQHMAISKMNHTSRELLWPGDVQVSLDVTGDPQ